MLAAGPISEQLYGALRFHREYRDGSEFEGLTNDQVPPAATYLGIAIYLEQSGVLTRSSWNRRYLSENRIQLAALFGRTAVEESFQHHYLNTRFRRIDVPVRLTLSKWDRIRIVLTLSPIGL